MDHRDELQNNNPSPTEETLFTEDIDANDKQGQNDKESHETGKEELFGWEAYDLFQLYYDTTPIQGSLDALLGKIDDDAVDRAIKIGACNVYHGCVHNMLYEKSEEVLKGLYKAASFVFQAIVFKQTKNYIRYQKELLNIVSQDEKTIIETFLNFKNGVSVDFDEASKNLIVWAKKYITQT